MTTEGHKDYSIKQSVVVLVDTRNGLLLQQRDNKPDITWPNKLSHWGGSVEAMDNSIEDAAKRELEEELGITPEEYALKKLATKVFPYINKHPTVDQVEAHIFVATLTDSERFIHTYEGAGSLVVPYDFDMSNSSYNLTPSLVFAVGEYRRMRSYETET